jgi:hypothetical protein
VTVAFPWIANPWSVPKDELKYKLPGFETASDEEGWRVSDGVPCAGEDKPLLLNLFPEAGAGVVSAEGIDQAVGCGVVDDAALDAVDVIIITSMKCIPATSRVL